jgi:LmbE family N-acetylglucosaminyl deacetylase
MRHIYLSPHLDDAVLSCGGAIHRQVAAGDDVQVLTFFTGEAEPGRSLSPFALEQHQYWGNPPRPVGLRCAEDRAALARLGAREWHLGYLDAIYRAGPGGEWLYVDLETLFGEVHPADPLAGEGPDQLADHLATLIERDEGAVLYAPLGAGHHVDHAVVHGAGRRLLTLGYRLAFYEDYPYAESSAAMQEALATAHAGRWLPEAIPLSASDLAAKVAALCYYRSQLAILFGGGEAMPSRVWAFAATRSPEACLAERIWWPRDG